MRFGGVCSSAAEDSVGIGSSRPRRTARVPSDLVQSGRQIKMNRPERVTRFLPGIGRIRSGVNVIPSWGQAGRRPRTARKEYGAAGVPLVLLVG